MRCWVPVALLLFGLVSCSEAERTPASRSGDAGVFVDADDGADAGDPADTGDPVAPPEDAGVRQDAGPAAYIPVRTQDHKRLILIPRLDGDGVIHTEDNVVIAHADGYPSRLIAVVPEGFGWTPCGPATIGPLELPVESNAIAEFARVEGGIAIDAKRAGTQAFRLTGIATLIEGGCEQPAGTEFPVELTLNVFIVVPTGSRIDLPCLDGDTRQVALPPDLPVAGSLWGPRQFNSHPMLWLTSESIRSVLPANAESSAMFDIWIRSPDGPLPVGLDSLSEWVTPSEPATYTFEARPPLVRPVEISIVGAGDVTAATADFVMTFIKNAPVIVEQGGPYRPNDIGSSSAYPYLYLSFSSVMTTHGPMCSGPPAQWFTLESRSPSVCEVLPMQSSSIAISARQPVLAQHVVRIVADGTCDLLVHAPDAPMQAGFPIEWRATFEHTEEFLGR